MHIEDISSIRTVHPESTSKMVELKEAAAFLKQERIPYITVGSSAGFIYGAKVKPNDMDIVVLEQDELNKLQHEDKIDRFNDAHHLRIDDNLSRLGIIFRQKDKLFVHASNGVYILSFSQPVEIGDIATLTPPELIRLAKSLVADRQDDVKANRLVANLTATRTIVHEPLPEPIPPQESPRDRLSRSPDHFSEVIGYSLKDFSRLCDKVSTSPEIRYPLGIKDPKALALLRLARGRLVIPFISESDNGSSLSGIDGFNNFYNRWFNFGRKIIFQELNSTTNNPNK